MEEIEVDVISYNKKMEKSGLVTCYFGLLILLTNLIPGIWEFAGMFIVSIGMLPIIIGALLINYNSNKIQKIGSIRIGERKTFINNYDPKEIINSEYKLIFSKTGFQGQSNYQFPFTIGTFTTNPGINSLTFINCLNKTVFKFNILIRNKLEYQKIKEISKFFNKCNETI